MGIFTINSAVNPMLGYDPGVPATACADYPLGAGQLSPTYLPIGDTLITATELWSEYGQAGVGSIFKGWWSDGVVYRYYSEGNILANTYGYCGGETTSFTNVGYSNVSAEEACTNFVGAPTVVYLPIGDTLTITNRLFSDAGGTTFAPSGWYSNGVDWIRWTTPAGVIDSGACAA